MHLAADDRYAATEYRRAGTSGLLLPPLSLGLWHNFGDGGPYERQRAIVCRAFDLGITHIDIANNYGPPPGSAEHTFGRIFREELAAYRDELVVSTKAGFDMWEGPYGEGGSRKHLLASLDQSLLRTGLDHVDVFYHHCRDPRTPLEESMGALVTAVQQGKALSVGLSNYSAQDTRSASRMLAERGVPLLLQQPSYSMLNRGIEADLLPVLDELGVGTVVYSPLEQGLLTDRYLDGSIPAGSRAAVAHFLDPERIDEEYLRVARSLQAIAQQRGQTLAQLALTWVLRAPVVTSAIVGASSVGQLEQNVAALAAPALSDEELAAIELVLA
jgi:L-glyceraldehyde 3-phosphate reductase